MKQINPTLLHGKILTFGLTSGHSSLESSRSFGAVPQPPLSETLREDRDIKSKPRNPLKFSGSQGEQGWKRERFVMILPFCDGQVNHA